MSSTMIWMLVALFVAAVPDCAGATKNAASATAKGRMVVKPFDYEPVRLNDGFMKRQFDEVRDYYMAIGNDAILHEFRKRAGLPAPGEKLIGSAHGGASTDKFGQWLSGYARMYASTKDPKILEKVNSLVEEWEKCIEPDGFFWAGRDEAPYPYRYEKAVAGLLDAYLYCGTSKSLSCISRITDWAIKNLDRSRRYNDFFSREGLEWYTVSESLYRAYLATGDVKYRDFAEVWEYNEYWDLYANKKDIFSRLPFDNRQQATWYHAYSHVNTLSSAAAAYLVKGQRHYLDTIINAYDFLQQTQVYATGAFGPEERLLPNDQRVRALSIWPNSAETQCGTWAGFKLSKYLISFTGDAKYGDWIERLIFNSIGASIPMSKEGHVFYHTSYSVWGYAKHNIGFPWACCTGTRPQAVADFADLIYFKDNNNLYVNLYAPSTIRWRHKGSDITICQKTRFPESSKAEFTVSLDSPSKFGIKLRAPGWLAGPMSASVNGRKVNVRKDRKNWITIKRKWSNGDRLSVTLPMNLWLSRLDTAKKDGFPAAVMYGPVVLAADSPKPGKGYRGTSNPSDTVDFDNLADSLVPVAGKALTYQPASDRSVEFRPFYEFKEDQVYYLYLDPDAKNRTIFCHNHPLGVGPATSFGKDWVNMGLYNVSDTVGASATYTFDGSGVRWLGCKFNDAGKAEVMIDGKLITVVDQYGPGRDLPFNWEHRGLAAGKHTIKITVLGRKTDKSKGHKINLAGFEVIKVIGGKHVNLNVLPEPRWTEEPADSLAGPNPGEVDMVLWLRADSRVQVRGDKVVGWGDRAGAASAGGDNSAFRQTKYGIGIAELASAEFPTGKRPVIRFDGDTGFAIKNEDALNLEKFTLFTVHTVGPEGAVIANYSNGPESGWLLANDGQRPDQCRVPYWFTGIPYDRMWSLPLAPGFHALTATYDVTEDGNAVKTIRIDGKEVGRQKVEGGPVQYVDHAAVSIGSQTGMNWFRGEIAEIIITSTVNAAKQEKVERYLMEKYGLRR